MCVSNDDDGSNQLQLVHHKKQCNVWIFLLLNGWISKDQYIESTNPVIAVRCFIYLYSIDLKKSETEVLEPVRTQRVNTTAFNVIIYVYPTDDM